MSVRTTPSRTSLLVKIGTAALGMLLIMLLLLAFPNGKAAADPDYQDFDVPLAASDSDTANEAYLGSSVDVSGDTVVVGAPGKLGQSTGMAYIYVRPETGWTTEVTATETATLTLPAAETAGNENFGTSVSISGDTIVVGAASENLSNGAAYVFVKPEGGWTSSTSYVAKLTHTATSFSESFGESVSVSGDTIVVGAPQAGEGAGRAYVFERPGTGWATATASIVLSNTNEGLSDDFGVAVDVNGDTIVVGARLVDIDDQVDQGAAYVFQKAGTNWISDGTPDAELTGGDAGDEFGTSVAVREDGRAIVVGAPEAARPDIAGANPPNAPDQGAAYVFVLDDDSSSVSRKIASDVLSSGTAGKPNDRYGQSVAISGDTIVVGAPRFRTALAEGDEGTSTGSAFVYVQPEVGPGFDNWESTETPLIQLAEINVRGEDDHFGEAVAAFGGYIVTGVPFYDLPAADGILDQGMAYLFQNGYCSAQSGSWHNPDTWVNGKEAPGLDADVCISSFHTVTMDVAPTLAANAAAELPEVDVRRLLVNPGAVFDLNTLGILVEQAVTNNGTMIQIKEQAEATNVAEILKIEDSGTGTRFRGADVESETDLGAISLKLRTAIDWFSPTTLYAYCNTDGPASPNYVNRCFTITREVSDPKAGATVTLWAFLDELNGILRDDIWVYHFVNGEYVSSDAEKQSINKGFVDIGLISVSDEVDEFSAFVIGNRNVEPTAVELINLDADQGFNLAVLLVVSAAFLGLLTLILLLRYRRNET